MNGWLTDCDNAGDEESVRIMKERELEELNAINEKKKREPLYKAPSIFL